MWILKNSTNLLSSLGHLGVSKATSIQTFDFSTLYTSIPHDLLNSRTKNNIINNVFKDKNGATWYTHIKVGRNKSYFTNDSLNGDDKYTANDICKMIEFLVDNIYVRFGGQLFWQMVGIPMGTNCAPLFVDLFLYSYENEFLDKLIKEDKRKLAGKFNLSYRYTDNLISFNNKRFKEYISDIKEITKWERRQDEDKTKTHYWIDLGYFGAKLWSCFQNIDWMIAPFASSSCLRSHFVISLFTLKNSQFLQPQNLPQLLLISVCFSAEIRATT